MKKKLHVFDNLNILHGFYKYSKRKGNNEWRKKIMMLALNLIISFKWKRFFFQSGSLLDEYGENEVIIMDDMPKALTCTSHSHLRFHCVWICELICRVLFFIALSFANKCTYSIHIDCIPDTDAVHFKRTEEWERDIYKIRMQSYYKLNRVWIELSECVEIQWKRENILNGKYFSNVNWIVTENVNMDCGVVTLAALLILTFLCVSILTAALRGQRRQKK